MSQKRAAIAPHAVVAIAAVSCSMLMYEILLTRICALRLFFHFSFLVISNCLLAIAASGPMIFIAQDRWAERARSWIVRFGCLYVVALIATYAFLLTARMESTLDLRNVSQILWFSVFNLVA